MKRFHFLVSRLRLGSISAALSCLVSPRTRAPFLNSGWKSSLGFAARFRARGYAALPWVPEVFLATAVRQYFALVPAPSVAPFFCLPTSRSLGFTPLTATYFTTSLKRVIVSLGMDRARLCFNSHPRSNVSLLAGYFQTLTE